MNVRVPMTDEQAAAVQFALNELGYKLAAAMPDTLDPVMSEHESALSHLLADYYSHKERDPRDPNGMTLGDLRQMRATAMAEGLRGL